MEASNLWNIKSIGTVQKDEEKMGKKLSSSEGIQAELTTDHFIYIMEQLNKKFTMEIN
jgi:hypothetical protein